MNLIFDRRQIIALGSLGLGALSSKSAHAIANITGFTHGVASGEPTASSVLLWTRFVAPRDTELSVEIARQADFSDGQTVGTVTARMDRDHIAKITIGDLPANRWFFYRFVAPDGRRSQVGRSRTLPDQPVSRFHIGVFSCANIGFGYFNAYAHAAARSDLDLMVHTGDYFYEYGPGIYPDKNNALKAHIVGPQHETVRLADYRLRYAGYRADPDLQRLHALFPMISMWDDHEFANDAYKDGAENHQSKTEGDWSARKRVAEQVYREWMPVSDLADGEKRWSAYQIGDLATIFVTESRISGRSRALDLGSAVAGKENITAALATFRDQKWSDPARTMFGLDQEAWLAEALRASTQAGTKWQVLAQQCVMGNIQLPQIAEQWVPETAPEIVRLRTEVGVLAASAGLPLNFDAWDGFPAARERLLRSAQAADADLIVLSGDSHNGWAFNLQADGKAAGVEFAGHSVSSPGFEWAVPQIAPADVAQALIDTNNQLYWVDSSKRGYMSVMLTPDQAVSTWHFLESITRKSTKMAGSRQQTVRRKERRIMGS